MPVARCAGCHCWRNTDSTDPCAGCAYWARRAQERGEGRRCHNCGSLLDQEETTKRCLPCRTKRKAPDFAHRSAIATAIFPPTMRQIVLDRLASGERITDIAENLGISQQRIHGFKVFDPGWAQKLDEALMAGRDPDLNHGTPTAHRAGCRCPECREAKKAPPRWWRKPRRAEAQTPAPASAPAEEEQPAVADAPDAADLTAFFGTIRKQRKPGPDRTHARYAGVKACKTAGWSYTLLGNALGLTTERARQMAAKYDGRDVGQLPPVPAPPTPQKVRVPAPEKTHDEALRRIRAAGWEPAEPYPGMLTQFWRLRCAHCGREERRVPSPTLIRCKRIPSPPGAQSAEEQKKFAGLCRRRFLAPLSDPVDPEHAGKRWYRCTKCRKKILRNATNPYSHGCY